MLSEPLAKRAAEIIVELFGDARGQAVHIVTEPLAVQPDVAFHGAEEAEVHQQICGVLRACEPWVRAEASAAGGDTAPPPFPGDLGGFFTLQDGSELESTMSEVKGTDLSRWSVNGKARAASIAWRTAHSVQ